MDFKLKWQKSNLVYRLDELGLEKRKKERKDNLDNNPVNIYKESVIQMGESFDQCSCDLACLHVTFCNIKD